MIHVKQLSDLDCVGECMFHVKHFDFSASNCVMGIRFNLNNT